MILQAFASVQRNASALFIYLAIALSIHISRLVSDLYLVGPIKDKVSPAILYGYEFLGDLVLAAGYAMAQCIAFSRIARDLDKPLWKVESDGEAARRFFSLWFVLGLINVTIYRTSVVGAASQGDSSFPAFLGVLWFMFAVLMVPVGAAIMFCGKTGLAEVGQGLSTLMHQLPRTFVVVLGAYAAASLIMAIQQDANLPDWARPGIAVLDGYADCVIFSGTWLICMAHRDEDFEDSDFDF